MPPFELPKKTMLAGIKVGKHPREGFENYNGLALWTRKATSI